MADEVSAEEYDDSEIIAQMPSGVVLEQELDSEEDYDIEHDEFDSQMIRDIEEAEGHNETPDRKSRDLSSQSRARSESPLTPPPTSPPRATRQAKIKAKARLSLDPTVDDDDSDLTGLEDILSEIEVNANANSSGKTGKAMTSKKAAKGKQKSEGKGKAKAKKTNKRVADTDTDSEEEAGPKSRPKKQLVAKAEHWDDIPDWGDSDRCQLFEMPAEVLDTIFGLQSELRAQEYVALAGTCKFFRHHLDEPFFMTVTAHRGLRSGGPFYPAEEKTAIIAVGKRPFTRDIKEWQIPRPLKTNQRLPSLRAGRLSLEAKPKAVHYTPRGERSTWTKAQYTVYKEEKSHVRAEQWKQRKSELKLLAKELLVQEKRSKSVVGLHYQFRSVLGRVSGREDGEPPIEKDDRGLPLVADHDNQQAATSETGRAPKSKGGDSSGSQKRSRENEDGDDGDDNQSQHARPNRNSSRKRAKGKRDQSWAVPEESESEDDYDELAYMAKHGYVTVHDSWPSQTRKDASRSIHQNMVNKTEAIKTYKITEAQLLTLSYLIVPNRMGGKNPTQLYYGAAVEALAFRAHGGLQGHSEYVEAIRERERERHERRMVKETKAKRDGTYVHKRKARTGPHWLYCCPQDPQLCYCDDCWDGECDCWKYCLDCGIYHVGRARRGIRE